MAKTHLTYQEQVAAIVGSGRRKRASCELNGLKYANFMYYCVMKRNRKSRKMDSGYKEISYPIKSEKYILDFQKQMLSCNNALY